MIIAIDGPAASGKGTIARRLAEAFGLPHLDTGLLYRATARAVLDSGGDINDLAAAVSAARGLGLTDFDESSLRGKDMGEAASIVASMPAVRAVLVDAQQSFAARQSGAVLDGRDIGTVICPNADAKIFVVAEAEVRAQRRALELRKRGEAGDYETVLDDIRRRDERDLGRSTAPLKLAADAVILDTTKLDIEAAVSAAMAIVIGKMPAAQEVRQAGQG
jgi:cytidylate kinase